MCICECVSICPLHEGRVHTVHTAVWTHTCGGQWLSLHTFPITLYFKCWVLVSHWMADSASLVSLLAMGIPYLHCPNAAWPPSMWVPEVRLVSLSLKSAPPRMFVCCLLGSQVERCSSYTMQCKGTFTGQLMVTQGGGVLEMVWRNEYPDSPVGCSGDLT